MEWTQGQQRSNMNKHNSQLTPLLKMIEDLIKAMQYASGTILCINMEIQYNLFFSLKFSVLLYGFSAAGLNCAVSFTVKVSVLWFSISRLCDSVWFGEHRKQHVSQSALCKTNTFVFLPVKELLVYTYQTTETLSWWKNAKKIQVIWWRQQKQMHQ